MISNMLNAAEQNQIWELVLLFMYIGFRNMEIFFKNVDETFWDLQHHILDMLNATEYDRVQKIWCYFSRIYGSDLIQGLTIKFQDCASKTGKKVSKKTINFFYSKYIPFESTQRWVRASKPRSARSKSICGIVFRAAVTFLSMVGIPSNRCPLTSNFSLWNAKVGRRQIRWIGRVVQRRNGFRGQELLH